MGTVVSFQEAKAALVPRIELYCRVVNEHGDDFDFAEFLNTDLEGIRDFVSFSLDESGDTEFDPNKHLAEYYFKKFTAESKELGTTSPHVYEKLCNFSRRLVRFCQDNGEYYRFIEGEDNSK